MSHKGPEIFDFRDSWLREIEAYQQQVKAHKTFLHFHENKQVDFGMPKSRRINQLTEPTKTISQSSRSRNAGGRQVSHGTGAWRETNQMKIQKTAADCQKPQEKSPQYIVNTYHAQLLKKNKSTSSSPPPMTYPSIIEDSKALMKPMVQFPKNETKLTSSSQMQSIALNPRLKGTVKVRKKSIGHSYSGTKGKKTPKKRSRQLKQSSPSESLLDVRNNFNISHRDATFQPTDAQNNLLLTGEAVQLPQIIVNPYHARLVQPLNDPPQSKLAVGNFISSKVTIPEAHVILENIHRTLNGIKAEQKPADIQLDKITEVIASNMASSLVEPVKQLTIASATPAANRTTQVNGGTSSASVVKIKVPSSEDKSNSDDGLTDPELQDVIDDESSISSIDTETEYKGHIYFMHEDSDTESDSTQSSKSEEISSRGSSDLEVYYTPPSILMPSLFPQVAPYVTFSSHVDIGPAIPTDLQRILKWKMSTATPKIVRYVVANTGLRLLKKTHDWMGTWDKHMKSHGFKEVKTYQKYNHLPGSFKIGRKDSLWRNLKLKIDKFGKQGFGFMRRTFIIPEDLNLLSRSWFKYSKQKTKWILKPPASARGVGVKLVRRWSEIPSSYPSIIQKYIEKPLLINGSKFDVRLYVLVTSVNPLRIFIYNEGLARFASVQYNNKMESIHDRCMHLTNYSINKLSQNYVRNDDINSCNGHKWTLTSLWAHLRSIDIDTKKIWAKIRSLVVRTIIVGEHGMEHIIRHSMASKYSCYELFGFDVLIDENLTPWLLEVNISPSLHIESPLDQHVKGPLVQYIFNTVMFQVPPKLTKQQQKDILVQCNLSSPLCYDRRLYVTVLSNEEALKHKKFTSDSIDCREDYLDAILEHLTPDDVRCLVIAEDELARSPPLERIFPGPNSHTFLEFLDKPRYYNRLLDAWEAKYGAEREDGLKLLRRHCSKGIHLKVTGSGLFPPDTPNDSDEDDRNLD